MSFSTDVKNELSRVDVECKTCQKASLSALLKSVGTLSITGAGNYSVNISTDNASIARFAIKYLHDIYNLETEITMRRSVLQKGTNYFIEVTSNTKLLKALSDLGLVALNKNNKISKINHSVPKKFINKNCCCGSYMRGAFLGGGYVSDPKGNFHFEIIVERTSYAKELVDILAKHNIKAGSYKRRNQAIVYIKSGQGITDFLAFTGGHMAALAIENVRVVKSIRNDEIRRSNVDVANITRSANAAVDQLYMIKRIVEYYGAKDLSPALQEFISLRVKYPDSSLKELGENANPPLSKSAINGRLRRLTEMDSAIPK